ncbi:heme ABC exporter ATP-binding protein CcmA [Altererythrobacter sp. GH1-8]|uniref:heme ABC exporter ATP-binding protein CcmA n=1 Tax=Altererythrobacter sp. GH1-8 TaxID=3349333 RepID=UPI00374CC369
MSISLTATDLACRRGERVLFRGLNLSLAHGEALHIAGANGIGKTSLLRILAGLLRPFAGSVSSEGAIGLLDERPGLDPELPLRKALGFWQNLDGGSAPSNALATMGLEPLLDVPLRYLSTGQRKRAAMAALLNRSVPIWLLDEPLSGLDAAAIDQVTRLIAAHLSAGGIAVIASHQPLAVPDLQVLELASHVPSLAEMEAPE